jgi:saccharopine dehydrogenase-like NADP-dependent oxidoreductase
MSRTFTSDPVLLIGGTGVIGRAALSKLRERYPELPLTVGSRSIAKALAAANVDSDVDGVEVDLSRPDLGLAADARFSAVVMFVKDETLNAVRYAVARGSAYLDISTATFEIGPEVSLHAQNPNAAAILLGSNWLAGTSTWVTLHFADPFDRIDTVRVAALLDDRDIGGEAAEADYVRQMMRGPVACSSKTVGGVG